MRSRESERLEPLIDPAIQSLKRMFEGGREEEDFTTARIASSVLSTWARIKQSERAEDAIMFSMARSLAHDREELERYLKVTMPDLPMLKVVNGETKQLPTPEADAETEAESKSKKKSKKD